MWLSWVFCFRVSPGCNQLISQNWSFTPRLDCTTVCFQTHVIVSRIQFCADYWRESFGPLLIVAWICPCVSCLEDLSIWQLISPKANKRESTRKTEVRVNQIMEMTFHHLCFIPLVRIKSLGQFTLKGRGKIGA